jgi:hypothetical protein
MKRTWFGAQFALAIGIAAIPTMPVQTLAAGDNRRPTRGVRSNARENGQISRATTVGAAQGDGSRPCHPPVLPERRKSAKISRGFGVHMGNPGLVATR